MSKQNNISKVRSKLTEIGDKASIKYEELEDLNAANIAIRAYAQVINAARAQIQYKKLTGTPNKIGFFEDEQE